MSKGDAREAIHDALTERGFERLPARCGGSFRYRGTLTPCDRAVAVEVSFPCLDFTALPKVRLLSRSSDVPGVVAHIEEDGAVCYAAPGSIVLDRYDPGGAAVLALKLATRTLADGIGGGSAGDVPGEFTRYWGGTPYLTALGFHPADGPAAVVSMEHRGRFVCVLTRDGAGLECFPGLSRRVEGRPAYLLRTDKALDLPHGRHPPETLAQLLLWTRDIDPRLGARLLVAIRHRCFRRSAPLLFITAPNGFVGAELRPPRILVRAAQRAEWLTGQVLARADEVVVGRWTGERLDAAFLVERNLAGKPSLAGRRIVLVGCGAIGSHLAKLLAQGGAGQGRPGGLWLVDDQCLSPGNVGRHLLGPGYLHRPKAEGVMEELLKSFPGANIHGRYSSAMDCRDLLAGADLLVDASGEEALSLAINEMLVRRRPAAPDALYAWLCGNGAAAQALLVSGKGQGAACRKCLHPVLHEPPLHDPVAAGWDVREVPAACGEAAFVPYGVAAPAMAAALAARMCMEWAEGVVPLNLRTVRVDHEATVAVPDLSHPATPGCPCCGTRDAPAAGTVQPKEAGA